MTPAGKRWIPRHNLHHPRSNSLRARNSPSFCRHKRLQCHPCSDLGILMDPKEKLSIVCFSGEFDRAVAALTLATGAAATNREVTVFFTFWGLNIVKKRGGHRWTGTGILARFFNFLMGGRNNLPLSRLNFGGISPRLMTGMMKSKRGDARRTVRGGHRTGRRVRRLRNGHAHPGVEEGGPHEPGDGSDRRIDLPRSVAGRQDHFHLNV